MLISTQVQLLRAIQAGIDDIERRIKQRLAVHPKAKLLAALPDVGMINLTQILAEVGPVLNRTVACPLQKLPSAQS